jgi:hypothetical protein
MVVESDHPPPKIRHVTITLLFVIFEITNEILEFGKDL